MRFDLIEYRAKFTFYTAQYVKKGELNGMTDFDAVFLCLQDCSINMKLQRMKKNCVQIFIMKWI